jgi:chromate reductase
MHSVAVIVGSLRRGSINKKLAHALAKLASGRLEFRFVEIGDLPLYNEDLWGDPPTSVLRFKQQVEAADAVLFVTPEYNRGTTGALKNAIDWGSRPWGKSSWPGKPLAIAGASIGAIGTAVAQSHVRQSMLSVGTVLMGLPELYLTYKDGLIDDNFDVTDESSRKVLAKYVDAFVAWIERQKR